MAFPCRVIFSLTLFLFLLCRRYILGILLLSVRFVQLEFEIRHRSTIHTHMHTECIRFTLYFSTNANNRANILLRYAAAVGVCEDEKNENRQIDFTVHILMRSVRASVCVRAGKSEKQKKDKFCFIADFDAESVRLWLGRKDFFCGTSAGAVLTSSCHSLQIADDACC